MVVGWGGEGERDDAVWVDKIRAMVVDMRRVFIVSIYFYRLSRVAISENRDIVLLSRDLFFMRERLSILTTYVKIIGLFTDL